MTHVSVYDYTDESTRDEALEAAATAVKDGHLIVLPTDTVYGIGADAFNKDAVQALLDAKGRGRQFPPPVLIGDPNVMHALGLDIPPIIEDLVEEYWPGALTVIVKAQPSLHWDLGETKGTVALRMPDHEAAIALLKKTGPLAVSSANKHGGDPAKSVMDAAVQLGDAVEVYLDGGKSRIGESSTIIDATVNPPEILRRGALSEEEIVEKFGEIFTPEKPEVPAEPESTSEAEPTSENSEAVEAPETESSEATSLATEKAEDQLAAGEDKGDA
ncbi:L-threonylcarbamoyladenylate synthase [Dermabacter sp. p3-SID358]|uniref:L-threonylcarbamoyladenylate synthase n=1 Tax=Dermabacter sp. p3-SID358 TaxID=2916114 RepID=UPI0021A30D37|nr:L-threonylcarbamoyladenylate synthase [Dermabacter sp. p3-SID358]MCT1866470.1 L-threonylcarbamoyladenylate synthase [Dermabacter sp. p3-SID358]